MTILLIDEDPKYRKHTGKLLERAGYTVVTAKDGSEGLAVCVEKNIDCVIVSFYMSVMSGLEFYNSIRELQRYQQVPVLFISASEDDAVREAMQLCSNAVLMKKGQPADEMIAWIQKLSTAQGTASPVPVRQTARPARPAAEEERIVPGNVLVLIVDDDDAFRVVLRDTLCNVGYTVATASGGNEAISMLEQKGFDLVLLDIRMPDLDGFEVLKFIKAHQAETKVIMITAYADLKLAVEAKQLGAADFIAKPYMRNDLLNTIVNVLKQP